MNRDQNEETPNTHHEKILNVRSFDEINDLIQDHPHDIIVIKFYSEICRFCRDYAPIYEQFNKNYGQHLIFTQVNIKEDLMFTYKFKVNELPTTMIIKDGAFYYKEIGILKYSSMEERFERLKILKLEQNE